MEFVLFFRINDGSKQHNQTPQTKGLHKLETSKTLIYFYCLFRELVLFNISLGLLSFLWSYFVHVNFTHILIVSPTAVLRHLCRASRHFCRTPSFTNPLATSGWFRMFRLGGLL